MNIKYDIFNRIEPSKIYLSKVGKNIIGLLNGVEENSCKIKLNCNNAFELNFIVDEYVDGEKSAYYDLIDVGLELYVSNFTWFKINNQPIIHNDGVKEYKEINCESLEIELQNYDLTNIYINCGTDESLEMQVEENIYEEDGLKLPLQPIALYKDCSDLYSLYNNNNITQQYIDLYLRENPISIFESKNIEIAINDDLIRLINTYKTTLDSEKNKTEIANLNKLVEKYNNKLLTQFDVKSLYKSTEYIRYRTSINIINNLTLKAVIQDIINVRKKLSLLDIILTKCPWWKIGHVDIALRNKTNRFEIDNQDMYSFITQDLESGYNCIILFDCNNYTINVYDINTFGRDTFIYLSFRNVVNDIQINGIDEFYTTYRVQGGNELGINYVNIDGTNTIENIDYFLTEKYLSKDIIQKYNKWKNYMLSQRNNYIIACDNYCKQLPVVKELYDRVPLDDCNSDNISSCSDDELKEMLDKYTTMKLGYETYYVDENNNFDLNAIKQSVDYYEYNCIVNTIIPNIKIEMDNRKLTDTDNTKEYITSWETDFSLYGLDELNVKKETYNNEIKLAKEKGYDKKWTKDSTLSEDYHNKMYESYKISLTNYNNVNTEINKRQSEINEAESTLNKYKDNIKNIQNSCNKNKFMSKDEINCISRLYKNTDYQNENFCMYDTDDSTTIINKQKQLYDDAIESLSIYSQPQFQYTTTLENFLQLIDYKDFTKQLTLGCFIRLGIRDDYFVKLRVMSISFNPMIISNDLELEFSNMLKSKSKRNDFISLLDKSIQSSKNSISSTFNSNSNETGVVITNGLLQKLFNNNYFNSGISNLITDKITSVSGTFTSINTNELIAKIAQIDTLTSDSAFIKHLESILVISDTGDFKQLNAQVANIQNALIGTSSTDTGIVINLTSTNAVLDKTIISEQIAKQISVADLQAGNIILSDAMVIKSENNNLIMNGKALQILGKDANNNDYVGIQLGYDTNENPSLILRNENGATILTPQGITKDAIADELINNDMIKSNSIDKSKLNFKIETDANGNTITKLSNVYTDDGKKFGVDYTDFKSNVQNQLDTLSSGDLRDLKLIGEQIFKHENDTITPNSIQINAIAKGVTIDSWYIDNVKNIEYVSDDKTYITIPSTYMNDKTQIKIKVVDTTNELYDILTIFKLEEGKDIYNSIITSSRGITFNTNDSSVTSTDLTCQVYANGVAIEPKSYNWLQITDDNDNWETIGTTKIITVSLDSFTVRDKIKCQYEI